MKYPLRASLITCLILIIINSCKKESYTTNSGYLLITDTDSLHFDTLFTSIGSVTKQFKIINPNNKAIRINSISLSGGKSSSYKINVDGIQGPEVNNVTVFPKDSIYVFVSTLIDATSSFKAFLVQDSIKISYNGNTKHIQLDGYGQNAHYLKNAKVSGNQVWNNDLPYVIIGSLTIDSSASLIINQGCQIHMHADAPFIINGTLIVNGDKFDTTRVVFSGDRLDEPYNNFPASYPGLIFTSSSKNNSINYAIIKNAYQGIVSTESSSGVKLDIEQTIIDNAYDAGLLALNSNIKAVNVLISNCGKNIILANGGNYNFIHCTSAAYSNLYAQHKFPVLFISDALNQNSINSLNASFTNCIFWGDDNGLVDNEVSIEKKGTVGFSITFDHTIWRVKSTPSNCSVISSFISDPKFDSVNNSLRIYNFHLKDNSPALNSGIDAGILTDLDGYPRPSGIPDIGCYEKR
jgi:hypothetical protein